MPQELGMKTRFAFALCAALSVAAAPAVAHHSFAMFDLQKTIKLEATVKEFQWTNPHSWLQVIVQKPKGKPEEWSLEMTNVGNLIRTGWRPATVKAGDKVVLEVHPRRDGTFGGSLMTLTRTDGKKFEVLGQGGVGRLR